MRPICWACPSPDPAGRRGGAHGHRAQIQFRLHRPGPCHGRRARAGKTGDYAQPEQARRLGGQEQEQGYRYPHDFRAWVSQQYLPDALAGKRYYEYGDNKTEQAARRYWEEIKRPGRRRDVKRTLGFGYCGLACCLCSEQEGSPRLPQRGLSGQGVVQKLPVRPGAGACGLLGLPGEFPARAKFGRKRACGPLWNSSGGMETALLDCLGVTDGQGWSTTIGRLTGDYDVPETVEVLELIERGAGNP